MKGFMYGNHRKMRSIVATGNRTMCEKLKYDHTAFLEPSG